MRHPPHSPEPWWAPGTASGFRQRCASALTHPVTVVALGTLLLNDLLFKSLWPHAWVTGKLSDLAWVIFALPLLAFLLSLFTRGSVIAARAAFLTAYAGLPLLYAAFNTFEPVHYWILRGISLASGGMGRTPLDATDSIVIPLGWAVAVWVWRRPALSAEALRLRLGLLVAGVAGLASIAGPCWPPEVEHGIRSVGVSEDGAILASARSNEYSNYRTYRSDDGGLSWTIISPEQNIVWSGDTVETPRGIYSIQGREIVFTGHDGSTEVVYSTRHLAKRANYWAQKQQTAHLDVRVLATEPRTIVYDEHSGNLIVALGIQGVLVGTPDGRWTPYAVGRYTPSDFTLLGKTRSLLSDLGFWVTALGLSLSMTALSLFIVRHDVSDWTGCVTFAFVLPPLLASLVLLIMFSGPDAKEPDPLSFQVWQFMLSVVAITLGIASFFMSFSLRLSYWRETILSLVGMNVLIILAFMLWLHLGVLLIVAKTVALLLTAIVAYRLWDYLRWRPQG